MKTEEYQAFISACNQELAAKQAMIAELQLFDLQLDLPHGLLLFVDGTEVCVEATVLMLGSLGKQSLSWMWAFANTSLPAKHRPPAEPLEQLARFTGRPEFSSAAPFVTTESEHQGLIAAACHQMGGLGVYQVEIDGSDWSFLVKSIRHLKSHEYFLVRAQQFAQQILLSGRPIQPVNRLRARYPKMRLDLAGADLRGERLPWSDDLHIQTLFDFNYVSTHASPDFSGANLSYSRFDGATLRGATLREASFEGSILVGADLSDTDLRGALLRDAHLNRANLTRAKLGGADLHGAVLSGTLLTNVDLSEVKGLEEADYVAPCEISLSTLIASHFQVTLSVLRKAGVSTGLMEDLIRGQRFASAFQTCFLSYSSMDSDFASHLYKSLQEAEVRVFWDRFDILPGESLDDQIVAAIREHNRLVVVLSRQSMASHWVKREIELAWFNKRDSLIPIRLCPIEEIRQWVAEQKVTPDITELFPIQDFSRWEDPLEYDHALNMLLRSLATGVAPRDQGSETS